MVDDHAVHVDIVIDDEHTGDVPVEPTTTSSRSAARPAAKLYARSRPSPH